MAFISIVSLSSLSVGGQVCGDCTPRSLALEEIDEFTWLLPVRHTERGTGLWAQQQASESHGDISASVLGGHMLGVIFPDLGTDPELLYFIHSFVRHDLGC